MTPNPAAVRGTVTHLDDGGEAAYDGVDDSDHAPRVDAGLEAQRLQVRAHRTHIAALQAQQVLPALMPAAILCSSQGGVRVLGPQTLSWVGYMLR